MRGGVSKGNPAISFPRSVGRLLPRRVSRFAPRRAEQGRSPSFLPSPLGAGTSKSGRRKATAPQGLALPALPEGLGHPHRPHALLPSLRTPDPSPSHAAPAAPHGTRAGAAELATDSRRNLPSPTRHLPAKTRNASFSNKTLQKSGRASKKQTSL